MSKQPPTTHRGGIIGATTELGSPAYAHDAVNGASLVRMNGFKSWLFSGGWCFLVAGLWLFTWLLGPTNGNGSSSVWMLPIAMMFLILGLTQSGQEKRRSRG